MDIPAKARRIYIRALREIVMLYDNRPPGTAVPINSTDARIYENARRDLAMFAIHYPKDYDMCYPLKVPE